MSWSDRSDDPLPPGHPEQRWRVSDLAKSLVRTWVPIAVGAVVAWLATRWGIVVPDGIAADAAVWVGAGMMAGYYYAARWLEQRRGRQLPARAARWLGRWMLGGVITQPAYPRE